jgi:hypothetical protein
VGAKSAAAGSEVRIMNGWSRTLACLGALLLASSAQAATLSLSPTPISVVQGDSFVLDLRISDLAGAEVGGFDVDLAFDSALLSFSSVTFSTLLGDEALGQILTDVIPGASTLNVAAVSLLSAAALDALQADPVLLASLTFQALSPGSGSILISSAELTDALAAGITLGAFAPVPVTVAIPEPATWLPVALGLALLARRRRRAA